MLQSGSDGSCCQLAFSEMRQQEVVALVMGCDPADSSNNKVCDRDMFIDVFLPDAMIYTGCKNVENWTIFEEDERMKLATNHMLNMINEIREADRVTSQIS